jgi:molybdenum cofactor guanylyltransferase
MPFLHPRFVAAVCAAAGEADAAVPYVDGFQQPLAAAYRTALAPLVSELIEAGRMNAGSLLDRCDTRRLDDLPHPESVRNLNTRADYEAALAEPAPAVHVRGFGPLRRPPADVRATTLGAAADAFGIALGDRVLAAVNGDRIARDPLEPLADGDDVAFMAADAAD